MKTLKFFPGWPEMSDLLKPFLDELDKIKISGEKQHLIAYSAGVISLAEYIKRNSEKNIAKIILICPAGKINRGLFSHCRAFQEELEKFRRLNKTAGDKIKQEVADNFFRAPIRSVAEISRIANFQLDKFLEIIKRESIKVVIIHVHGDDFMFNGKGNKDARNIVTASSAGHFAIIDNPKNCADIVKDIIEERK